MSGLLTRTLAGHAESACGVMDTYDWNGQRIEFEDWIRLAEKLAQRVRVALTFVDGLWVSTIWVGLDYSLRGDPPLIFETVTHDESHRVLVCTRTPNAVAAEAAHDQHVANVQAMVESSR